MTSSNGNIFCVTGPLCVQSTGDLWIPLIKASNTELWCFLWCAPEQTAEQTVQILVIWDATGLAQRAQDVTITSLLRENDVTTSFWRKNDVTITSCVRWVKAQIRIGHIPTNTQRNKHVIVTSKHRFDVIITRLLRCVFAGMRSQRKAAYSEGTESVSHTPILSYVSQSKKYEAI